MASSDEDERVGEHAQQPLARATTPMAAGPAVTGRASLVVRPGAVVTLLILSCVGAGLVIFWLLRSMHI